jgi:hypothetical protein
MSFVGNLTGGLIGKSDAEKVSAEARQLSQEATDANIKTFEEQFGITTAEFQPYLDAGAQAISDLMDDRFGDPESPELASFAYPNPNSPDLDVFKYATPKNPELQQFVFDATALGGTDAYKFRYGEGLQATERLLAANRGVVGPNAAQELQQYGQGMASQEYGNEWSRQLKTNLTENERRQQEYRNENTQYEQEQGRWANENQRRQQDYSNDISRYGRASDATNQENKRRLSQFGMESDRYGTVMDRLFALSGRGQTATTQLASYRSQTAGGIAGARGQNVADQFAASLIPVQEKQQWVSGLMETIAAAYGAKSGNFNAQSGVKK